MNTSLRMYLAGLTWIFLSAFGAFLAFFPILLTGDFLPGFVRSLALAVGLPVLVAFLLSEGTRRAILNVDGQPRIFLLGALTPLLVGSAVALIALAFGHYPEPTTQGAMFSPLIIISGVVWGCKRAGATFTFNR